MSLLPARAAAAFAAVLAVTATGTALTSLWRASPTSPFHRHHHRPALGVYAGPAGKGVAGMASWEGWSGVRTPYALDFADADSWSNITGPEWQLAPWRASGRRLIYSLPMFVHPEGSAAFRQYRRLVRCARGGYDRHWAKLARNLVAYGLSTTIVRPGWEFNGDWYDWHAAGREWLYARCFRRIVRTMRTVPGHRFAFLWNPAVTLGGEVARKAYPGDTYVDYVGVDVYDLGTAVPDVIEGRYGLRFWAGYARRHGKELAIPEWGLASRPDGSGGGDNPRFVERMVAFARDPANRVAFIVYFDADATDGTRHRVSHPDSVFPTARQRLRQLLQDGW